MWFKFRCSNFFSNGILVPGQECLTIERPYYMAFIAGWCFENLQNGDRLEAEDCFDVRRGVGYGRFVDAFTSRGGGSPMRGGAWSMAWTHSRVAPAMYTCVQ